MSDDDESRTGPQDRITLTRSQAQAELLLSWFPPSEYPSVTSEQDAWLRLFERERERRAADDVTDDSLIDLAPDLKTESIQEIGLDAVSDAERDPYQHLQNFEQLLSRLLRAHDELTIEDVRAMVGRLE
jgi:hypothetical protein